MGGYTAAGTTTVPVAVTTTIGSASTEAADRPAPRRRGRPPAPRTRAARLRRPTAGHRGRRLDDVAGPHRRQELHVGVGREQPLVAVGADAHLGGHVAEQAEDVGAVDQVAGVVGVAVRHVAAVRHRQADSRRVRSAVMPRPPAATRPGVSGVDQVAGHLAGRGAAAEDPVDAEARPPCVASNRGPPTTSSGRCVRPDASRNAADISRVFEQVRVALGDDLGDQHRVGLLGRRPGRPGRPRRPGRRGSPPGSPGSTPGPSPPRTP